MTSRKRARPAEGDLERWARQIVAKSVQRPVDRHDDGLVNAQVDALIRTPAGNVPLEVVGDHDSDYNALRKRLEAINYRFHAAAEQPSWAVTIRRGANVNAIESWVVRKLAGLNYANNPFHLPYDAVLDDEDQYEARLRLEEEFRSKGVVWLTQMPGMGEIRVRAEGWPSWEDPVDFLGWVERIGMRDPRKAEKLRAFGGDDAHLFMWATLGRVWAINSMLMQDDDDEPSLPMGPPHLPDGVTDVWVASTMSRRDCLHWSARTQWERFEWEPGDEPTP